MEQPIAVQPTQEFTLKLNAQELSVINSGLGELPLKVSGPVAGKIDQMVFAQAKAAQEAASKPADKAEEKAEAKPAASAGGAQAKGKPDKKAE